VLYYDLTRNWSKIQPHLRNKTLNKILVEDFNKYTFGRWVREFEPGEFPRDYETCLWDSEHQGPEPRFWRYVKHGACHWLVNFELCLAQLTLPKRRWRIITSDEHSTVWDGRDTLFEFNFLALKVSPDDCFRMAYSEEGEPGDYLNVSFARHYTEDIRGDLSEHDAESFRRRMTRIRDIHQFEQLTDEKIALFTPYRIKRFYDQCKAVNDPAAVIQAVLAET
jgi:hypothetical protein